MSNGIKNTNQPLFDENAAAAEVFESEIARDPFSAVYRVLSDSHGRAESEADGEKISAEQAFADHAFFAGGREKEVSHIFKNVHTRRICEYFKKCDLFPAFPLFLHQAFPSGAGIARLVTDCNNLFEIVISAFYTGFPPGGSSAAKRQ